MVWRLFVGAGVTLPAVNGGRFAADLYWVVERLAL